MCALDYRNSSTISGRKKNSHSYSKTRGWALQGYLVYYCSPKCSQATAVWKQKSTPLRFCHVRFALTSWPHWRFGLEGHFKQLLKNEKTTFIKLYSASLESRTDDVQSNNYYFWQNFSIQVLNLNNGVTFSADSMASSPVFSRQYSFFTCFQQKAQL